MNSYDFQKVWCTIMTALIIAVFLNGCDRRYGFIESNFSLSDESRLPMWFTNTTSYPRKDLSMTITLYSSPSGGKAKMILYGPPPEHKKLLERVGMERWHPLTEQQGYDKYPNYSIVTVDGIEEVFEQRRREDILYVTDDPTLTAVLKK